MSPSPADASASGPVLQLLARGLQLWLRQHCRVEGELQIQLEGSALNLVRGRLEGVHLQADRVTYNDLRIAGVTLHSGAIRVQMANLLRGQPLQLDQPFEIRGQLRFNPADLGPCFGAERWQELAGWLAQQLLGARPPLELQARGQRLQISATSPASPDRLAVAVELVACPGGLAIRPETGAGDLLLPLGESIQLEDAHLEAGQVLLTGTARVTP